MSFGKEPAVACASCPFGMFCLSAISMMFCENSVGSVYVGGYGGSERKRTCGPVCFLVVGKGPSVLL